jgi:ABC-2 type transport system permease protein
MKNIIAKKEILQAFRDKRFWIIAVLVWGLLLSAALVGYVNYRRIQTERAEATKTVNAEWQNQGDKNPHSAAHYGSFAYRPKSPLSFLDFGTDTYTGMSVRMEAHKQNDAVFSAAQESTSLIRFGELSTAFVLQVLMPLIIIFLCFGAFTQEKEDKTL